MSFSPDTKPTIKDVARVCGVSVATVSYVINGTRVLKQDTRERVLKAMEEMNYHPNAVARGLSSKRVHTLGVHCGVVHSHEFFANPYASGILQGVLKRAAEEGFDVTLFSRRWENAALSAPPLSDGRTDGILVIAPSLQSDILSSLSASQMPLVAISAASQPHLPIVDVDNYEGMKMAVRHLIELGHTRIAAILGNDDLSSFVPRRQGVCDALTEADLQVRPDWIMASRFSGEWAFEQTSALLQSSEPPTAICAGNDTIAVAIIEAARYAGVCVPEQLSVVGFDDSPSATLVTPNLTTVRQPLLEIGNCAAGLLIDRMRGHKVADDERHHLLSPELIVRGSTSAAP
ncbi:LacI family transcriptional regulator [bacterium]|nr:MAG: LacI family transcriptional regulator [bacterium]